MSEIKPKFTLYKFNSNVRNHLTLKSCNSGGQIELAEVIPPPHLTAGGGKPWEATCLCCAMKRKPRLSTEISEPTT